MFQWTMKKWDFGYISKVVYGFGVFFGKSVFSLSAKQCFWLILSFQITNEWVDYFQFLNIPMEIVRRIQKAPPLIPWTYIFSVLYCNFQTYNDNIGLIFQKLRIVTLGAFIPVPKLEVNRDGRLSWCKGPSQILTQCFFLLHLSMN